MNVYRVTFGAEHEGGYDANVVNYNVLADSVVEAMDKTLSKAHSEEGYIEVFESVEYVLAIDVE